MGGQNTKNPIQGSLKLDFSTIVLHSCDILQLKSNYKHIQ